MHKANKPDRHPSKKSILIVVLFALGGGIIWAGVVGLIVLSHRIDLRKQEGHVLSATQIIMTDRDGIWKLQYDCDNFKSIIKTREDIKVLAHNVSDVVRALPKDDVASKVEISNALNHNDFKKLELLVVAAKCADKN